MRAAENMNCVGRCTVGGSSFHKGGGWHMALAAITRMLGALPQ